ncbi:MAG: acyloxyacyl hydrolase [Flavobacteriales bacterium]
MHYCHKIIYIVFTIGSIFTNVFAQQDKSSFFELEYLAGRVVPNYSKNFPNSSVQQALVFSMGKKNTDTLRWGKYYNFPETGISLFATNLGNDKIYGNQLSCLPFIRFKVSNRKPVHIKLALGLSYFTTHYDSLANDDNVAIGSAFTWGFQAMLYKTIYTKERFNLKLVGGYSHHSNGHTQIPNFGLNSALFGIAAQWDTPKKKVAEEENGLMIKNQTDASKKYFINCREGIGFHELGATAAPVGGDKKKIFTSSLSFAILFKNHIKWKSGFSYRYYQHYYDYSWKKDGAKSNRELNLLASNVYFFTGVELLMNHFSIDVEGGLNLYKPFYKEFNKSIQKDKGISYELKKWFNSRLGVNYYMVNTVKKPVKNLFIGAHINANFGQADFSEFSLGYVHMF